MMKKWMTLLLAASLLVLPATSAWANDYDVAGGNVDWDGSTLHSNLSDLNKEIGEMQPGDTLTFTVDVKNSGSKDTDFWMSNKVLASFEDNTEATGGAYTYRLEYSGPNGSELFYNSTAVGGDTDKGLYGVEDSIDENAFFFLGTLAKGQSGKATLFVQLNGETQGNNYQDKDASLELIFGVEENNPSTVTKTETKSVAKKAHTPNNVKTGDEFPVLPFSIAAIACGVLLLVLAAGRRKKAVIR